MAKDFNWDDFETIESADAALDETPKAPTYKDDLVDLGRGVAQGATLNFSDELVGAGEATADKIKSLLSGQQGQDWLKSYRQHQQESESANMASKERSPFLYGAGELGGGIATGIATAGAGGAVTGVGKALATGAGLGGLQAAGASKGSLDSIEGMKELGKDVAAGTVIGGGIGAVAHGLGSMAKPLASKDNRFLRQAGTAFEEGKKGVKFTGEEASEKLLQQETDSVSDLTRKVFGADKQLGEGVKRPLQEATEKGITVQIDPGKAELLDGLIEITSQNPLLLGGRTKSGSIINNLQKFKTGDLTPLEAWQLRDDLFALSKKSDNPSLKNLVKGFGDEVRTNLRDIPGFSEASDKFKLFRESVPENILNKTTPGEFAGKKLSDTALPKEKLFKQLKGIVQKSEKPGVSGEGSREVVDQLKTQLMKFEEAHPGTLSEIGINPEEMINKIKSQADLSAIRQVIQGYEPQAGFTQNVLGGFTPRGKITEVANLAGRGVKTAKDFTKNLSQAFYSATPDELVDIAKTIKQAPGLSHYAEALERGLQNKDVAARNAALFTILQNPQARALFKSEE